MRQPLGPLRTYRLSYETGVLRAQSDVEILQLGENPVKRKRNPFFGKVLLGDGIRSRYWEYMNSRNAFGVVPYCVGSREAIMVNLGCLKKAPSWFHIFRPRPKGPSPRIRLVLLKRRQCHKKLHTDNENW